MAGEVCSQALEERRKLFHYYGDLMLMEVVSDLIIATVASLGNLLVICALWKASSIPSNLKKLFISLSLSDIAVGLFLLLFSGIVAVKMHIEAIEQSKLDRFCPVAITVFYFFLFLLACASFLNVTAITLDRLLAVFLHLRYRELVTSNRVLIAVVSLWLTSFAAATIYITLPKHSDMAVAIIEFIGLFLMTMVYIRIYKVVRYHQNQIEDYRQRPNFQAMDLPREKKSAFSALIFYVVFVGCYLPNVCCLILSSSSSSTSFTLAKEVTVSLVFLNSALNPLVYCWRYREIRVLVKSTVKKIFCVVSET